MSNVLLFWSLIVLFVVGVVVWHTMFRRRTAPKLDPGCSAETAWRHYFTAGSALSERDRRAIQAFPSLGSEVAESIRASVATVVGDACAGASPQRALRSALMDATDRFVLSETVDRARHPDHDARALDADPDHVAAVVEAGVIRAFAKLRHGDAAEQDWYTHYLSVAQMNSSNVAAMVRKTVEGETASLETSLHDPLTRTMQDVRTALLDFPPRQPVTRSHEFTKGESRRLHPTRRQIDELTKVMGVRFERLFAGQIYRLPDGSPVDRSSVFRLDAGLLYCVLAQEFRYPEDSWEKVMTESLGPSRGVIQADRGLLDTVRGYHETWKKCEPEGPLKALIDAVRGEPDGRGSAAGTDDASSAMLLDASHLVGKLRSVVEQDSGGEPGRAPGRG